jgi:uncharacterized membrane protein
MLGKIMPLSRIVMIMAVAAIVIGIVFIYMGVSKTKYIQDQMSAEQVSVSVYGGNSTTGGYIDNAAEAQAAADRIKEHRHSIAPSYGNLTSYGNGGKGGYDPTSTAPYPPNPNITIGQAMLDYTQALNMENYLYMGVFALGFTQAVTVIGVFMILVGIALMAVWAAIRKRKKEAEVKVKST